MCLVYTKGLSVVRNVGLFVYNSAVINSSALCLSLVLFFEFAFSKCILFINIEYVDKLSSESFGYI